MKFYWLLFGVLTVWRLTHLVNAKDGPWGVVMRLRRAAGTCFFAGLLDCSYCLSLWMAVPVAHLIGTSWMERVLLWPALTAGAIFLERVTLEKAPAPPCTYPDREDFYVLRRESSAAPDLAAHTVASIKET
jgi:hypothetical protein